MNIDLKNRLMALQTQTLVFDLRNLVANERKLKAEILHYLWVVQQKRVFAEFGYPSLFEFCMRHLGYTEAESQRRISAMRLLGEIPELEAKITDGKLSLSSLSMAQSLFRQEAKGGETFTREKKIEVLGALENKSVRQCENVILRFSTVPPRPQEKMKPLSDDLVQVSFVASKEFVEKLEKLKALRSHKSPGATTAEVLEDLLDRAIQDEDPGRRSLTRQNARAQRAQTERVPFPILRRSVSVARKVKRDTWLKHGSRCAYVDPATGQKCNSSYFLEIEHVKPRAKGGSNDEENLKLYCRAHNQLAAIQQFGFEHMDGFLNGK